MIDNARYRSSPMKNDAIWRTAFRHKRIEVIEMIETTLVMAQQPQVIDFAAAGIEKTRSNQKPLPATPAKALDVVSDVSSEGEVTPIDEKKGGGDEISRRSSVSSMSPENDSRSPLDDLIREIMASQVAITAPAGPVQAATAGEGTPYAESPTDPDFKSDNVLLRPKHFQNREPKLLSFVPLARDSRGVSRTQWVGEFSIVRSGDKHLTPLLRPSTPTPSQSLY